MQTSRWYSSPADQILDATRSYPISFGCAKKGWIWIPLDWIRRKCMPSLVIPRQRIYVHLCFNGYDSVLNSFRLSLSNNIIGPGLIQLPSVCQAVGWASHRPCYAKRISNAKPIAVESERAREFLVVHRKLYLHKYTIRKYFHTHCAMGRWVPSAAAFVFVALASTWSAVHLAVAAELLTDADAGRPSQARPEYGELCFRLLPRCVPPRESAPCRGWRHARRSAARGRARAGGWVV